MVELRFNELIEGRVLFAIAQIHGIILFAKMLEYQKA